MSVVCLEIMRRMSKPARALLPYRPTMSSHRRPLPPSPSWPLFFFLLLTLVSPAALVAGNVGPPASDRKAYVVYMGDLPEGILTADAEAAHRDILDRVIGSGASSTNILHSYKRSFSGFSAMLTAKEAKVIRGMDGVVSVFPSKNYKLHTTRSWDFMNFPVDVVRVPSVESDVIVGMIDTGIWPDSKSFDDTGYGPPPSKWKGTCQTSSDFKCNNKIIGARFYGPSGGISAGDVASPLDTHGHGTHTASTVAGRNVAGADLFGLAKGTARGGVPSARIAVYKACWSAGCTDADILAAFDDAIADGVDILSVSLGGAPVQYFLDSIAIGSFHAMKKGILTVSSAGNNGPSAGTVTNISPWTLTVAANTIDRRFVADAKLGNGMTYEGVVINTYDLQDKMYPLIYGGDAPANKSADPYFSQHCFMGALDEELVNGKIVLCDSPILGVEVSSVGGVGAIMKDTYTDAAHSYPLPGTVLDQGDGTDVHSYIRRTSNPTATISKTRQMRNNPEAPFVASFSSRGPNTISEMILKPDLTAPGVDILAAWSPLESMSESEMDKRRVAYNIISGTSMSCPHVSGIAAYVKTFHPTWSPAAIKSALMTTASPMRPSSNPDAELAYGAGHINPVKAVRPGLIYDAGEEDYVRMLCGDGYSTEQLRKITGDDSVCSADNTGTAWDLNYPSFALPMTSTGLIRSFHRTVTNVGSPNSIYRVTVNAPPDIEVDVNPAVLSFKRLQEKQSFVVKVRLANDKVKKSVISASLTWSDGVYEVRSPIVFYTSSR